MEHFLLLFFFNPALEGLMILFSEMRHYMWGSAVVQVVEQTIY